MSDREQFLALIESNIDKHGYHVTIVNSPVEPRYAYTIGLSEVLGFEFIFAGGIYYKKDDLFRIFDEIIKETKTRNGIVNEGISVDALGTFSFSKVKSSWSKLTMLGVFDFYKRNEIEAYQVIPDQEHHTLDIPDMSKEFNVASEPVWQWLDREWDYPVPRDSTVVTNLDALKGEVITEVMKWEKNEWEIFAGAGPDVLKEDKRVVSLGTLLGIDKSLMPAAFNLEIEKGMWRDPSDLVWHAWG